MIEIPIPVLQGVPPSSLLLLSPDLSLVLWRAWLLPSQWIAFHLRKLHWSTDLRGSQHSDVPAGCKVGGGRSGMAQWVGNWLGGVRQQVGQGGAEGWAGWGRRLGGVGWSGSRGDGEEEWHVRQ